MSSFYQRLLRKSLISLVAHILSTSFSESLWLYFEIYPMKWSVSIYYVYVILLDHESLFEKGFWEQLLFFCNFSENLSPGRSPTFCLSIQIYFKLSHNKHLLNCKYGFFVKGESHILSMKDFENLSVFWQFLYLCAS